MAANQPGYIIPDDLISKVKNLGTGYLEKHPKVSKDQFANAKPLGKLSPPGKLDLFTRRNQIYFLRQVAICISDKYPSTIQDVMPANDTTQLSAEDLEKLQQRQYDYIKGQYLMVAAAMLIMQQIAGTYEYRNAENSQLYLLLAKAIGVKSYHSFGKNKPSHEDLKRLFLASKQIWKDLDIKQQMSQEREQTDFEVYRNKFAVFIDAEAKKYAKKEELDLPLTRIIVPITTKGAQWIGWSLGFSLAREAGNTTPVLPTITTTTSALALASRYASYSSGAIIAFSVATAIVQSTMIIFSAALMGELVKYAGTGIGYGIGLTADFAWKGLKAIYHLLKNSLNDKELDPRLLSGFDISNQTFVQSSPLSEEAIAFKEFFAMNIKLSEDKQIIYLSMAEETVELSLDTLSDEKTFGKVFQQKIEELLQRPAVQNKATEIENKIASIKDNNIEGDTSRFFSSKPAALSTGEENTALLPQ